MATIHTLTPPDRQLTQTTIARSRVEGALALVLDTVDHLIATLDDLDGLQTADNERTNGLDLPLTEAPSRIVWLCNSGLKPEQEDNQNSKQPVSQIPVK